MTFTIARPAALASIVAMSAALAGCMGPTYGTGTSQGETLFNDINGLVTLGGGNSRERIDYSPRAALVKPENTHVLPPPQATRTAANDGNWPESPEQRSARIRAQAYQAEDGEVLAADFANRQKEGARPARDLNRISSGAFTTRRDSDPLSPAELVSRRDIVAQRAAASKQGSPTQRAYLSEPPIAYRQPASTAPVGDPGVDESVKERRIKNDEDGLGTKLRNLLPW